LHLKPGQGSIQGSLNRIQSELTIGGNSSFQSATPTSITGALYAAISVVFQPFPWEARSLLQFLAVLENLFVASRCFMVFLRWRRRIIRARLDGMAIMSLIFLLVFCVLYSNLGNFGLLVREWVTFLPILLTSLEMTAPIDNQQPSVNEGAETAQGKGSYGHDA
jgi:hypothetical protein